MTVHLCAIKNVRSSSQIWIPASIDLLEENPRVYALTTRQPVIIKLVWLILIKSQSQVWTKKTKFGKIYKLTANSTTINNVVW